MYNMTAVYTGQPPWHTIRSKILFPGVHDFQDISTWSNDDSSHSILLMTFDLTEVIPEFATLESGDTRAVNLVGPNALSVIYSRYT